MKHWIHKAHVVKGILLITISFFVLSGCQGYRSDKPPFHMNPNMDWQPKVNPQKQPIQPVEGTVAWGNEDSFNDFQTRERYLKDNTIFYQGKTSSGKWVKRVPIDVTEETLNRGQDRYNIYCAVCHTKSGDGGKSQISKRGWVVSNLTLPITVERPDGELFDIISNGIRTMPGYKKQLSEQDRWSIVTYVRALQKVKTANLKDVPKQLRDKIK